MAFREFKDDKIYYTCDICSRTFQFGPHVYQGRPVGERFMCNGCAPDPWKTTNA